MRARDRLAYAYLMSRHLDFALRFLPEERRRAVKGEG